MRIIQLIQKPQARGAEIFTALLSKELERLGHQLILVSLFEGDFRLPFKGKQIHLNRPSKKRFWDIKAWRKLNELIQDFQPDIVQANAADTLKFSVFTKMLFPGKYTLLFNNGGVISTYLRSWPHRQFNRFLLRKVDALISVSKYSKDDLDKIVGNPKKHQVIPIGIDLSDFPETSLKTSYQVVVHLAGFTPEKNHEAVVRIFGEFIETHPNSQLWFMGEGPLKSKVEALVSQSSFSDKVRFFGSVSSPFSLIPRNAILLLPSKIEGLPSVILEAFHSKIPVIAFQVGGIPDLLIPDQTGFLVPKADEKEFVAELNRFMELSSAEKERLKENAFQLVQDTYGIAEVAKKFEGFYMSLCASSN
ncbi:glycosyltransferase family 4 protein [Algoriphagus sp. D3-2-R+10]|uniref:glycosyltransferase family 4 protein n=1 Tax=Algoriphagus aurantiacus TaxID=3103948 RepID=UPI002B36DF6D|nr:glycosyltransferase family 4 protein [Algoriphagus sp. D3-2-R+10]MEB2778308.1 glycosyltransferase family 4 protein [Algoriphagus sp. D3-2-R+10]